MHFLFKRYVHGVLKRRLWLLLIFVLPCLYLFISSIQADLFTVTQNIRISESEPIALTASPVGHMPLKDIVSDPKLFFQNSFATNSLSRELFGGSPANLSEKQSRILKGATTNMSMAITGKDMMMIQYHGANIKAGKTLVNFYSKRLFRQAEEGISRSRTKVEDGYLTPSFTGGLYIIEHRALWRSARFVPTIKILFFSCIAVFILLWIMEWSDSSFKSERQIGRYLKLPVLGSVPDLDRVSDMILSKY